MAKRKKGRSRGRGGAQVAGRTRPRPGRVQDNGRRLRDEGDAADSGEVRPGEGVLEMHPNGYGFLRDPGANYIRQLSDPFVPGSMIDKYNLREGLLMKGLVQPGRKQQGPRLKELHEVDGMPPDD